MDNLWTSFYLFAVAPLVLPRVIPVERLVQQLLWWGTDHGGVKTLVDVRMNSLGSVARSRQPTWAGPERRPKCVTQSSNPNFHPTALQPANSSKAISC